MEVAYGVEQAADDDAWGRLPMMSLLVGVPVRLLVGGLLALAGAGKILSGRPQRERWLQAYGLVPAPFVPAVAFAVPCGELLAGSALLLGFGGWLSLAFGGAILVPITAAAAVTLARGRRPDCGCFGRWARDQLSWRVVIRNLVLIGLLPLSAAFGLTEAGIGGLPVVAQATLVAALVVGLTVAPRALTGSRTRRPVPALSPVAREV